MAVGIVLDFAGGSMAQYHQVVEKMALGGRMPAGGMFHAAGTTESGFRVIDVWEDLATFAAFRDAKIMPLAAEAGLSAPEVLVVDVHEQKRDTNRAPKLVQVVKLPGMGAAMFRETDAKVLEDGIPEQMTFHVNGPIEGGWCVIDAWDDEAAYERFANERIGPNVDAGRLSGPPEIEILAVEATMGAGARATA